jgi:hypothetical protein
MARKRNEQDRRIVLASPIDFGNTTELSSDRLLALFLEGLRGWSVGRITVRVRYSRGADFSGTCFYADKRVFVNIGRHLMYPYRMDTNIARAKTRGSAWRRPLYSIELKDAYQLSLFVFMHELYHLLVKRAGRNTRQKEAMCDRYAARHLADRFHTPIRRETGERAPRVEWDFQELERFVAAARDQSLPPIRAARRALSPRRWLPEQLLLFRL